VENCFLRAFRQTLPKNCLLVGTAFRHIARSYLEQHRTKIGSDRLKRPLRLGADSARKIDPDLAAVNCRRVVRKGQGRQAGFVKAGSMRAPSNALDGRNGAKPARAPDYRDRQPADRRAGRKRAWRRCGIGAPPPAVRETFAIGE
jgi:hypothetical protein